MCASTASGSPTSAASRRPIATSTRSAPPCLPGASARQGMVMAVHAEDHAIIDRRTQELHRAGHTSVRYFPESRPVEAEVAAVGAALRNAAETGVATYLAHLSSRDALAQLRSAKAERRATVY